MKLRGVITQKDHNLNYKCCINLQYHSELVEFWALYIVRYSKNDSEHVLETAFVSVIGWGGPTLLGPLEGANPASETLCSLAFL
jgi:hypothetical protein